MKRIACSLSVLLLFFFGVPVSFAGMSSSNYQIFWDSVNSGGNELATSTNYGIHDTLGDVAAGTSTSATYQLIAGYRAAEANTALSLDVRTQDKAVTTGYSALNIGGDFVTVSSTSGFGVNDYVAVIENVGFSQRVVTGRILSVNVGLSRLTVDGWSGAVSTIDAAPAETSQVNRLDAGLALGFGTIGTNVANTQVIVSSVVAATPNGYHLYLQPAQALHNVGTGAPVTSVIPPASVTVGVEGYGVSVTGTHAYLPDVDAAVTSTQRVIQTSATPAATPEREALTYKLSVTPSTPTGAYSQALYYTLTANF